MKRITKDNLYHLLNVVGTTYEIPTSENEVNGSGKHGYLALDHYQPGGNKYVWMLVFRSIHTGAEYELNYGRLATSEMYYYLDGLSEGNFQDRVNRKNKLAGDHNLRHPKYHGSTKGTGIE